MASNTPNYSFLLPTVGGDTDQWGGFLNQNWTTLDALLAGDQPVDGINIVSGDAIFQTLDVTTSGTLTGVTLVNAVGGLASLSVANEIEEGIQTIPATLNPTIDPENGGTLATWALTASQEHDPVITLQPGEHISLLMNVPTGASVSWGTVVWFNGTPVLEEGKINAVELFADGGTTYGVFVGST